MSKFAFLGVTALLAIELASAANAAGVCSTGDSKSCRVCCANNPSINNRALCSYQCGEYDLLKKASAVKNYSTRQKK